jgi:hypothetical protein
MLGYSGNSEHFMESNRLYHVHMGLLVVPILSQKNLVHTPQRNPISPRSLLFLPSHLLLGFPSGPFPKLCRLSSLICVTCLAYLFALELTIVIFVEEWKLQNSSVCSFLQPTIISSLIGPHIILSTVLSLR